MTKKELINNLNNLDVDDDCEIFLNGDNYDKDDYNLFNEDELETIDRVQLISKQNDVSFDSNSKYEAMTEEEAKKKKINIANTKYIVIT